MKYEQLTPSQKKAVFHLEGPLLVLAGPGSGKTRVITYRIAALIDSGVKPHNICAITFTNKAAEEMRQRAFCLGSCAGVHISTFHSLCVRILRQYANAAGIKSNFSIYNESEQAQCIKQAVKHCELDASNFSPARMLDAISTLKNKLIDINTFRNIADDFFSKTLVRIYDRYQQILSENNALDFDDLLMKAAQMLDSSPDICRQLGQRFKFLLVDEYQDTNYAQYKIAKALVSTHNNICVTGDPDQSIYRWRGADIRNILAFEKDWPNTTVVKLEENFRSTPNILKIADNLIANNQIRKQKTLIPVRPLGKDATVNTYEDELEEAHAVAQQVKDLIKEGISLKDIAVFYRINAASRVLEEAFVHNKIPYQIIRGVEFYSRKEIRDLLAYLKILVNPDDDVALLRIINTPPRGIGKTTIDRIRSYATLHQNNLFDALKKVEDIDSLTKAPKAQISLFVNMILQLQKCLDGKAAPVVEKIFTESGLKESFQTAADHDALENIYELINAVQTYDQQTDEPSLQDYLQEIALFSDIDAYDNSKGSVAFMTLHAAKGLEFESVFIVGLEDGLLPHERGSGSEEEIEEERRLFFVGITRAKSRLFISHAKYRTIRGQLLRSIPSQFLYELGDYIDDDADITDSIVPQFAAGQLVRHKIFGLGRVIKFLDMGENSIAEIKFNTGQTKTLMLKYTDLTKVD